MVKVRTAELFPLGHDDQRIGLRQRPRLVASVGQARRIGKMMPCLGHRHRVIGGDRRPSGQQILDDLAAGGLAHVVGIGLERQPPHGKVLARQLVAKAFFHLGGQHMFLRVVGCLYRRQHLQLHSRISRGGLDQRLHILGKARAAVPCTRVQKVVANARVRANTPAHVFNVSA